MLIQINGLGQSSKARKQSMLAGPVKVIISPFTEPVNSIIKNAVLNNYQDTFLVVRRIPSSVPNFQPSYRN